MATINGSVVVHAAVIVIGVLGLEACNEGRINPGLGKGIISDQMHDFLGGILHRSSMGRGEDGESCSEQRNGRFGEHDECFSRVGSIKKKEDGTVLEN